MAKELADSERAHTGTPGMKVRHGADAVGMVSKPYKDWKAIATKENITALPNDGRPNAHSAARKYSEGGNKTQIVRDSGKAASYTNGMKDLKNG